MEPDVWRRWSPTCGEENVRWIGGKVEARNEDEQNLGREGRPIEHQSIRAPIKDAGASGPCLAFISSHLRPPKARPDVRRRAGGTACAWSRTQSDSQATILAS